MNIIVVDDEKLALESTVEAIINAQPDAKIFDFRKTAEALEFLKNSLCEIAFLDIEMRGMTGIELAKKFKDINPKINIIFVTGYSDYMKEAFEMHASGYILKPPTKEMIEKEIKNLRNPILYKKAHVRIQTFGNFEIFVDGVPITFRRAKSKELLAFLVDRKGAGSTSAELAGILWEDKEYNRSLKNQIQTIISDMMKKLKSVNAENIIIKKWNDISIDMDKVDCDYYNFLKGDISAINSYTGEYMANYSWAEFTTGFLSEKIRNI